MKRYFILISLLLIILTTQSFAFFTELFELGKFVINQAGVWADNITEEVFRKTMVLQTIESVNTLKKNYEETTRFYKEIQQLQENLYGITEEAKHKFLERLNYSVDNLQKEMDLKIKELENESKQIVNTKIVDYIKSNWDLGNKIVQTVEDRKKELKGKIEKLANIANNTKFLQTDAEKEKARAEVEQIKNELLGMQVEILNQQNLLLLKIFELQNSQLQQMLIQKQLTIERQKAYAESVKKFLEEKKKQFFSNEEYTKRYTNMK
jgi:hypothetical protein